jgi:hypothetical protein
VTAELAAVAREIEGIGCKPHLTFYQGSHSDKCGTYRCPRLRSFQHRIWIRFGRRVLMLCMLTVWPFFSNLGLIVGPVAGGQVSSYCLVEILFLISPSLDL